MNRFIVTPLIFNQQAGHVLMDGRTGKLVIVAEDASLRTTDALATLARLLNTLYGDGDRSLTMRSGRLDVRGRDEILEIDLGSVGTLCRRKSLLDERVELADEAFEAYNFGESVHVVEYDHWDTSDPNDLTRIVYVEAPEGASPETPSDKISFHVHFSPSGRLMEAYALDMRTGSDVGFHEAPSQCASATTTLTGPSQDAPASGVCGALQATQQALSDAMQYAGTLEVVVRMLARATGSDDPAATLTDLSNRARTVLRT